jgi:predicted MFS family arabinose efflux permease
MAITTSLRPRRLASPRRPVPLRPRHPGSLLTPALHLLFFVAAAAQSAIVPLLPRLGHVYHLSAAAQGLLLAAPGLATLVISVPAGVLSDRLGARRVTIAAAGLMCVAALAQAAPSYGVVVAGRFAFGLAFGIVWTTGVAWMSGVQAHAGSPQLGAVATSAAAGLVAGPGIGGVVADRFGLASPFILVAGLAAALMLVLTAQPGVPQSRTETRNTSMRQLARVAPRHPGVLTGALVLAITGAIGGVTQLLVPLQLHQTGFTASATGIAFSAAAGVYILVSGLVVKMGHRATTGRWASVAALVLALSLIPAALDPATGVLVAVLLGSTAPRAIVSTVSYPLATASAAEAELADGAVLGLLNGTWAIGLVLAPLMAGAVEQAMSPAAAYMTIVIPAALLALWLISRRPGHRQAPEPADVLAGC